MDTPNDQKEEIRQQLRPAALEYHEFPIPGKISVTPTKQLTNQRDLSLAYSPGVAASCEEIVVDPANAHRHDPAKLAAALMRLQQEDRVDRPRQRRVQRPTAHAS